MYRKHINQTYTNLEILINNDGSTDNSYKICESYAAKDYRIRLFTQENSGVSVCRNNMLDVATGDYIIFVDSDDWIHPEHVERLVSLLEDNGADSAACSFRRVRKEHTKVSSKIKTKINKYTGKMFAFMSVRIIGYRCYPWGRLLKRESLKDFSFPRDRIFEDMFTIPELMLHLNYVMYTSEKLYYYRLRQDSQIHVPFTLKRTDELDSYINLTRVGIENNSKPIARVAVFYFILSYVRFWFAIVYNLELIQSGGLQRYIEKYKPYQRLFLRMFFTNKYKICGLLMNELIPLR